MRTVNCMRNQNYMRNCKLHTPQRTLAENNERTGNEQVSCQPPSLNYPLNPVLTHAYRKFPWTRPAWNHEKTWETVNCMRTVKCVRNRKMHEETEKKNAWENRKINEKTAKRMRKPAKCTSNQKHLKNCNMHKKPQIERKRKEWKGNRK